MLSRPRSGFVSVPLLALTGVALWALAGLAADDEKGVLASLISRALSTPTTQVSIGRIDGALSSDATVYDIQISDRDGVWLKLDRARLVWRRLALLQKRLEIDTLEVGTLDVARKPIPAEQPVAGEDQPLLPELPVKVDVKDFKLAALAIGEPILGTAARVAMSGSAKLGDPAEGLDLRFEARRLDAGGQATIRVGLVPQGNRLDLSAVLDEPAGGILARAISIPGLPPVKADISGRGTLDAFNARITFAAGDGIGADGTVTANREGAARRLALDLSAQVAGLLPGPAAPVFAGTTRLTGTATYGDDGSIAIAGVTLAAAAAKLDIAGRIGPDRVADIRITAANLPNSASVTKVSETEIRRLAFDGRVTGALASPRVVATLAAEDARSPAGRLGRLDADFTAAPTGLRGGATLLDVRAVIRATGIAPADAALARAIGGEASLTLTGTATTEGVLDVALLDAKTPTATAQYTGRLGSSELDGKATIAAPDLSRFADLAGDMSLKGALAATAALEGTPRAHRFNAAIDAHATRFATGIAALDGILGGRLDATGTLRLTPTGGYGFENVQIAGTAVTGRIAGMAAPDAADLTATLALSDLKRIDARLTGRADATVHMTGSLAHPDATARATVTDATALGRPVPRLTVDLTGRDITGAADLRAVLDGEIDRRPARGTVHVARPAGGGTVLDGLDVTIGSASLVGAVALDAKNLASGRLAAKAPNLDDLSPLALSKLSGALDADLTLAAPDGGQDGRIVAHGSKIDVAGVGIDRVDADLRATDFYRRPVVAGTAAIDEARVGGERISRVRLNATAPPAPAAGTGGGTPASDIILTAAARGFDLDARARVVPGDRTRIVLQQFGASRGRERIGIAAPATFTLVDGGVDIRDFALGLGAGRLTVSGRAGSQLDLAVAARAVSLSAAAIAVPGLGLTGTLDGEARLTGAASAPSGEYRVRVTGLAAPQTRSLGLPPAAVDAAGRLADGRVSTAATIAAGRAGSLRITGSAPLGGAGALDIAARGTIDAGAATTGLLAAAGRRVTGRVEVDARVGGTLAAPNAGGTATLSGGTFSDAIQGTQLSGITARVVARGDEIAIETLAATARNGGTLSGSGRVRLDPAAGFPGQIRVTGRGAELVRSGLATAVVDADISLSGPLARDPRVAGRIGVVSLDVPVPDRLPASLNPLPNTRHLHPTRTAAARLALEAKQNGTGKGGRAPPPFDAVLDLTVSAPGHIVVHGRGLNAELGGDLRVTGTLAKPVPNGAFAIRSGRLEVLTTRLDFSRGRLTFAGDLTPELDFLAQTTNGGVAIQIAVTGPANEPQFAFTSSPDLPQDEVLSRLLFGVPSGQLNTSQALTLAAAAAQYSGDGNGAFENLRRSLGLGALDVNFGSGGPGAGFTKGLNDRISAGVRTGATPAQTGVGVDVKITDDVKLKAEVGATGATSLGIGAEKEW